MTEEKYLSPEEIARRIVRSAKRDSRDRLPGPEALIAEGLDPNAAASDEVAREVFRLLGEESRATYGAAHKTIIPRAAWEPYVFGPQYLLGANILCPVCKRWSGVVYNHTIDSNGVVDPSFVCRQDGCTFHQFIVLENWDPNALADRRRNGSKQ